MTSFQKTTIETNIAALNDTLVNLTDAESQIRDADFALEYVKQNARTPEAQQGVLDALRFKTHVLWAQLDALHLAYVDPGMIPPGAFVPEQA